MLKLNSFYKTSTDILYISSYDVTTNRYYGTSSNGSFACRILRRDEPQFTYCGSFAFFKPDEIQTYMQSNYPEYFI